MRYSTKLFVLSLPNFKLTDLLDALNPAPGSHPFGPPTGIPPSPSPPPPPDTVLSLLLSLSPPFPCLALLCLRRHLLSQALSTRVLPLNPDQPDLNSPLLLAPLTLPLC
ncbi:uncharacterized protein BO72DRAFT_38095 [Aspergillus fijiensis CBS 313.89]|uniref:Uncharacterized protein n=1 Tax=Aspergillus fijiensis CBS 313.89 TaxID=1448319 RepID=A0A8G1VTE7_9EURO|nr:uncharacterized protein BO72DRAFT_38095 [Aspergillus fijiensis CBS 313.89]RAK71013.1 hypothetical protein BO72DRAFT_38095 [Aspergillus fijiensis CBS 313.89]